MTRAGIFLYTVMAMASMACKKEVITAEDEMVSVKIFDFTAASAYSTSEGGYIINCPDRIVKLTSNGSVAWTKSSLVFFAGTGSEKAHDVKQTSSGQFIVSGISWEPYPSTGANKAYVNLVNTTSSAGVNWTKSYSITKYLEDPQDEGDFNLANVLEDGGGNYLFTASVSETGVMNKIIMFTVDGAGNIRDKVETPFNGWGVVKKVIRTGDNGVMVVGKNNLDESGNTDGIYCAKFDEDLNLQWDSTYVYSTKEETANQVIESGGMFYVSGYINRGAAGLTNYDFFLMSISPTGAVSGFTTFDSDKQDFSFSMAKTSDGSFVMAGGRRILDTYNKETNLYVIKADPSGSVQWEHIYGEQYGMEGIFITENSDESLTVIGYKKGYGNSAIDHTMYVVLKQDGTMYSIDN